MITYENPDIILLPTPVGIDLAIQNIQAKIGTLAFMEKVFGRAFIQKEIISVPDAEQGKNKPRTIIFPECYGRNREPINVMPNDNFRAMCFFYVRDPAEYIDYEPMDGQIMTETPISVIFWFNLEKIDSSKDWRYMANLIVEIQKIFLKCPQFRIKKSFEQFDKVLSDFTLTETYRQYTKPPYAAIRFDGILSYPGLPENC